MYRVTTTDDRELFERLLNNNTNQSWELVETHATPGPEVEPVDTAIWWVKETKAKKESKR